MDGAQSASHFPCGFEDLGMEATREFEVEEMQDAVTVNSREEPAHRNRPAEWCVTIGKIPLPADD